MRGRVVLRMGVLLVALAPGLCAAGETSGTASAPAGLPEPTPPRVTPRAIGRDPFGLTPRMHGGGRGGAGYVQLLRAGEGSLPPMTLRGLIHGAAGRVALLEVHGVGQYRVREGENIQLTPTLALKVEHVGREELVLRPLEVDAGQRRLIIK